MTLRCFANSLHLELYGNIQCILVQVASNYDERRMLHFLIHRADDA